MSLHPPNGGGPPSRSSSPFRPSASASDPPPPLIAHPLLAVPSASTAQPSTGTGGTGTGTPPKYAPYQPRHRLAGGTSTNANAGHIHTPAPLLPSSTVLSNAGSITTGSSTVTATSQQYGSIGRSGGGNTASGGGGVGFHRKLQMTNLHGVMQGLGLDVGSVGWAVVEWFVNGHGGGGDEGVWDAVSEGKATLLLPLETASKDFVVGKEFVKDHVVFVDDDTTPTQGVTLSGLRGSFDGTTFTITTSLSPSSKSFKSLLSSTTRSTAFTSLPPLPLIAPPPPASPNPNPTSPIQISHSKSTSSSLSTTPLPPPPPPTYPLQSHTPSLPLPLPLPLPHALPHPSIPIPINGITPAGHNAPPLPPRPSGSASHPPPTGHGPGPGPGPAPPVPPRPSTPVGGGGHSRLSTLASLFGGRGYAAASSASSSASAAASSSAIPAAHVAQMQSTQSTTVPVPVMNDPLSVPPSPTTSVSSFNASIPPSTIASSTGTSGTTTTTLAIPAYTIPTSISRPLIGRTLEAYILGNVYHRSFPPSSANDTEKSQEGAEDELHVEIRDPESIYTSILRPLVMPFLPLVRKAPSSPSSYVPAKGMKRRIGRGRPGVAQQAPGQQGGAGAGAGGRDDPTFALGGGTEEWIIAPSDAELTTEGGDAAGKLNLAKKIQDAYIELEDRLREGIHVSISTHGDGDGEVDEKEREMKVDALVGDVMVRIEGVLCGLFYDRLFSGPEDATHDASLMRKAEGLGGIVGLGELGVVVRYDGDQDDDSDEDDSEAEEVGEDRKKDAKQRAVKKVNAVILSCAQVLSRLNDPPHRSPGEKARLLIEAHKVLVEGLKDVASGGGGSAAASGGSSGAEEDVEGEEGKEDGEGERVWLELKPEGDEGPSRGERERELEERKSSPQVQEKEKEKEKTKKVVELGASPLGSPKPLTTTMLDPQDPPSEGILEAGPLVVSPVEEEPPQKKPRKTRQTQTPPPLSSDLLLPLLIYTLLLHPILTCNTHLLSHLLYIQRFRCPALSTGEEAFCLVNILAGVEYVLSAAAAAAAAGEEGGGGGKTPPSPISLFHPPHSPPATHPIPGSSASPAISTRTLFGATFPSSLPTDMVGMTGQALRGRVDVLAGSANKVISGVMDSSFGILRGLPFLPSGASASPSGSGASGDAEALQANGGERPGLLGIGGRSPSGLSIRSMLPTRAGSLGLGLVGGASSGRGGGGFGGDEEGRPLVMVSSRPGSVRALSGAVSDDDAEDDGEGESEEDEEEDGDSDEEEGESEEEEEGESSALVAGGHDTRSIRSFESMMRSAERTKGGGGVKPKPKPKMKQRKSLSDRLATVSSGFAAGLKGSPRSSIIIQPSSTAHPTLCLEPPKERFLECAEDGSDLRIGEVRELLREYRRVVGGVRDVGGFDE